jgi:hypothetical protein
VGAGAAIDDVADDVVLGGEVVIPPEIVELTPIQEHTVHLAVVT